MHKLTNIGLASDWLTLNCEGSCGLSRPNAKSQTVSSKFITTTQNERSIKTASFLSIIPNISRIFDPALRGIKKLRTSCLPDLLNTGQLF